MRPSTQMSMQKGFACPSRTSVDKSKCKVAAKEGRGDDSNPIRSSAVHNNEESSIRRSSQLRSVGCARGRSLGRWVRAMEEAAGWPRRKTCRDIALPPKECLCGSASTILSPGTNSWLSASLRSSVTHALRSSRRVARVSAVGCAQTLFLLCLLLPLRFHSGNELQAFYSPLTFAATSNVLGESVQDDFSATSPDCSLGSSGEGASCLLAYAFDAPDPFHLLRTTPKSAFPHLYLQDAPGGASASALVAVSSRRLSLQDAAAASPPKLHTSPLPVSSEFRTSPFLDRGTDFREIPPATTPAENASGRSSARLLSDAEIFDFAVRRLQGFGSLFGGSGAGSSSDRAKKRPGSFDLDADENLSSTSLSSGPGGRKVLVSNGLVCEDDARVEEFGAKCKLIARSLGGRLGCEKKLSEIAPDGQLPPTIPAFSRVADACPLTCGLCEECAPGCALWFLGNTLCDEACNNALCQFDGGDCWSADCVVSEWNEWSNCSVTCGGPGTEKRNREIKSKPKQGGSPCPKLEETREGCNADVKCPENCVVSEWGEWSDCSTTCGEGQSRRQREILKHPDTNGQKCPETEQARVCMKDSCTTACVVSEWSEWGPCGASCGGGERTRKRSIVSPPVNGGALCPSLTEDEVCNDFSCDGGCEVGPWSDWSSCTAPCGGGTKTRMREVRRKESGADCPPRRQEAVCNQHICAIDCAVSEWTPWSACSVPCGEGQESRRRHVTTEPEGMGSPCPPLAQDRPCFAGLCSSECLVSDWSEWSVCTASCGFGTRTRQRSVETPPTESGGAGCPDLQESEECFSNCPVSCVVGEWEDWGECTDLCHQVGVLEPITTRSRAVLLEAPDCPPPSTLIQSQSCVALGFHCDVDCEVGEWGAWGPCSATCGGGQRRRRRAILRPPTGQGKACPSLVDVNPCALESCAALEGQMISSCIYGEWSPFRECDATCGVGRQRSMRAILAFPSSPFDPEGNILLDSTVCTETDRFQMCHGPPCPVDCQVTAWGAWSSCSVTCGGGQQDRLRSIVRPAAHGGKECPGLREVHPCATYPCPTDCRLSDWTEWTACSADCGLGSQTRTRRILTPASVDPPGASCGPLTEERRCFAPRGACREDCELSAWNDWTGCSQSCGLGGVRTRSRQVAKPGGLAGGRSCAGESLVQEEACNESVPCVGDCEVGDWGEWTGCSVSCSEKKTQEELKKSAGGRRMQAGRSRANARRLGPGGDGAEAASDETKRDTHLLSGGGKRMRSRAVLKPEKNGGMPCPQTEEIDDSCNADVPCPVECTYTPWTDWTPCSVTCGVGKQTRHREIATDAQFGGRPCDNLEDFIDCMADVLCVDDCEVSDWGEWSTCSASCGGGVRKRGRKVLRAPTNGGRPCPPLTDFDACGLASCHGTDCEVGEWSPWSSCSKVCGGGVHARTRPVLTERRGSGRDCPSPLLEREGCNLFRCPDTACEDNPDVPVMTGGVECRVLLAMGCQRLLKDLAEENDREFPAHIPPETRVQDACPATCGTCAECAPGCQLRDLGNRHCDDACNNAACQMDLGDCGGDCELDKEKKPNFFAALGLAADPPTSTLLRGQTAVLSCTDAGTRLAGFPALRQLAVACRGRDIFELFPQGLRLAGARDGETRGELGDVALPACVPDACPFVYVDGFGKEGENGPQDASLALQQLDGVYYRGDAQRGFPRYVQEKVGQPKYFLWMHAEPSVDLRSGPDSKQTSSSVSPSRATAGTFVWRLTASDPLESETPRASQRGHTREKENLKKLEKAAGPEATTPGVQRTEADAALLAVGTGTRCRTPPVGKDGPLDCVDFWSVGEVDAAGGAVKLGRKIPGKDIILRCLSSEAEKEELLASLLATAVPASDPQAHFEEPPSTVVAGSQMFCEDQPDVERVSQKTCAELKKLLKCDFVLADAGVDELPEFLPADATLALACPQTCGLCRECAFRCPLWFLGNKHCDAACNNAACEFDRGDCLADAPAAGGLEPNAPAWVRGDTQQQAEELHGAEECVDDATVKEMGYSCKLLLKVAKEQFPALGCATKLLDLNPNAQLPPGVPEVARVKDACPKSCDACSDPDLLRRGGRGTVPHKSEKESASCEDDPAVREMGSTCRLLLAAAEEGGKGGCDARLLDLDEQKQELPRGVPATARVKDLCPKTCNACNGTYTHTSSLRVHRKEVTTVLAHTGGDGRADEARERRADGGREKKEKRENKGSKNARRNDNCERKAG
ncbi:sushi domain (scr repeat) domain-containing protein, partial [Toxoplasma gondii VAND]